MVYCTRSSFSSDHPTTDARSHRIAHHHEVSSFFRSSPHPMITASIVIIHHLYHTTNLATKMTALLQKGCSNNLLQRWKRPLERHFSSFSVSDTSSSLLFDTLPPPAATLNLKPSKRNQRLPAGSLVGDHMKAAGERIAQSNWIQIENIPPTSSLEAMLEGVKTALEKESKRGIVDLDAPWDPVNPVPSLQLDSESWIQKAHVNLSTMARPTGWFIQLQNRSLVQALLNQSNDSGLFCSWKKVMVSENKDQQRPFYNVSDATIRVENCPFKTSPIKVMNLFSRYDLIAGTRAVEVWEGSREDKPLTYLVHFADASWARSALREKQGEFIGTSKLLLAQFPKQIV